METFSSYIQAQIKEKELKESGVTFTLIDDTANKIKPATHYLVRRPSGEVAPFYEACPEKASFTAKPVSLYYIKNFGLDLTKLNYPKNSLAAARLM